MAGEEQAHEQEATKPRGRKSVHWRRDPIITARLPDVERRHLAGRPNTAIAVELGISERTVREDLSRLAELWRERIQDQQEAMRARIVAKLEDRERRAIAAAEFDEAAERAVLYGDGDAVRLDDKGRAEFRGQKAQALNVARQAVMDQAKVLGLLVEKQEHSGEVLIRRYEGIDVAKVTGETRDG